MGRERWLRDDPAPHPLPVIILTAPARFPMGAAVEEDAACSATSASRAFEANMLTRSATEHARSRRGARPFGALCMAGDVSLRRRGLQRSRATPGDRGERRRGGVAMRPTAWRARR